MRPFPVLVFLSAFLLFEVQPVMGRFVLPWFGGTPAVWTACLLFFQAALLGGYLYAHLLGSRPLRTQLTVHTVLLLLSLALLPITPSPVLKPVGGAEPVGRILLMLAATVGAPYFLLSATAPLLQRWFSASAPGAPWRLYAISNLGSFLALLSYPIVIEPFLRLRQQAWLWSVAYGVFVVLCCALAWSLRRQSDVESVVDETEGEPVTAGTVALWVLFSATSTIVLMSVTNELSQEVAVSPFLWIAPLAIYLLTFVLAFDHPRWYQRTLFAVLAGVLAPVACVMTVAAVGISLWMQAAAYLGGLFAVCMLCHGELVLSRPAPRYLTAFYLAIAAGGVAGGLFTAFLAPRLFQGYSEFPLAFGLACILGFASWLRMGALINWTSGNIGLRVSLMALLFGGVTSWVTATGYRAPLAAVRNFYGILRVVEPLQAGRNGKERQLTHGRIKHGMQYLTPPQSTWATSYYGPHTGVGLVLNAFSKPRRRVAVVGLGTGTIAAWGRAGDEFRFYEINPAVEGVARKYFTYLEDSPALPKVILGDARVTLERELSEGVRGDLDVIAVDAFSSDSIPTHLLTREFAELCRDRLAPGGLLLFHISNRTVNLEPIVRALAEQLHWHAAMFVNAQDEKTGEDGARWVLLTSNQQFLEHDALAHEVMGWTLNSPGPILWTDDFSSVWQVLK